ncbi:hypothetical protein R1sor_015317 [Riccia sorocarpa]|uniref:Uncharacterized protein n=1 Tax=Riccia sorocarpa TaxID=122646 RepID=A0ABD3HC86_9MARC
MAHGSSEEEGFELSAQSLVRMGMSAFYGARKPHEEIIELIHKACEPHEEIIELIHKAVEHGVRCERFRAERLWAANPSDTSMQDVDHVFFNVLVPKRYWQAHPRPK